MNIMETMMIWRYGCISYGIMFVAALGSHLKL